MRAEIGEDNILMLMEDVIPDPVPRVFGSGSRTGMAPNVNRRCVRLGDSPVYNLTYFNVPIGLSGESVLRVVAHDDNFRQKQDAAGNTALSRLKKLYADAPEAKNLIVQEQIMLQVFLANRNTQEARAYFSRMCTCFDANTIALGRGGTIADSNNAAIQVVNLPNSSNNKSVGKVVNMIDNDVVKDYDEEAAVHDVTQPNNNINHTAAVGVVITINAFHSGIFSWKT